MGGISAKHKERFNDLTFIEKLRAGNESAYRELYDGLSLVIKSFVKTRYGILEEDAKDITGNFFLRIGEKIAIYDETRGRFLAFAFQIVRNLTVDWLRRNKKLEFTSLDAQTTEDLALSYEDDPTMMPQDDLSPLEKLPLEVRTAIFNLNDRYQQFIGLMLSGKTDEAIAEKLNIPTKGALWTLRTRVIAKLKEEVEKLKIEKEGQS